MSELHAYAYESGYQDGLRAADTEREALTRRIDELCAEVEQLKGENAKLREERREYQTTIDSLVDECADHKAENKKLLELLADTLMQPRDYCQKYGIEYDDWDSVNDHLDARMRELGVGE